MNIILGRRGAPEPLIKPIYTGQGESAAEVVPGFQATSEGILAPSAPVLVLPENHGKQIILATADQAPPSIRSLGSISENLEDLANKVLNALSETDRAKAKIFFEHFLGTDHTLIEDREFLETSHFFANQKPGEGHQARQVSISLQEFNTQTAQVEIDNLVDSLFTILKDTTIGKNQVLRSNAIRMLYHGLSYIQGYDWSKHLNAFVNLLEHPTPVVRGLAEQSLKILYEKIDSKDLASSILEELSKRNRLSGDLAQLILYRFPELKDKFEKFDFSQLSGTEIMADIDHYASLATNQIIEPSTSNGQVGVEIKIKLRGENQRRAKDAPIQISLSKLDLADLVTLGFHKGYEIGELRTNDGGFKLDSQTQYDLLRVIAKLQAEPDLVYFLNNHVNIDVGPESNFQDSILQYRRDEKDYWESNNMPSHIFFNDGDCVPFCYENSALIDQIKLHDELIRHSLKDIDLNQIESLLTDEEKFLLKNRFDSTQDCRVKILINIAEQLKKPELVPLILRLYKSHTLPSLNYFFLTKEEDLDFAEQDANLRDNSLSLLSRYFLARKVKIKGLEEIEGFLKDPSTNVKLGFTLISRLGEVSFEQAKRFIRADYYHPYKEALLEKISPKPSFAEAEELLGDSNIPSRLKVFLLEKISSKPSFAEAERLLVSKDLDYALWRMDLALMIEPISQIPFETLQDLLLDEKIALQSRIKLAYKIQQPEYIEALLANPGLSSQIKLEFTLTKGAINFEDAEGLLRAEGVESLALTRLLCLIRPMKFDKVEAFLSDESLNVGLRMMLVKRIKDINFDQVKGFLANESIAREVRTHVAHDMQQVDFDLVKDFLTNENIYFETRIAVARKTTKQDISGLEEFFQTNRDLDISVKAKLIQALSGSLIDPSDQKKVLAM